MTSTYTGNIGIEKPATGEQAATWGDTANVGFDIVDQSIGGMAIGTTAIVLPSAGTSGSPNLLTITKAAVSDGRLKYIEFTDAADLTADVFVQLVSPNLDDLAQKIVYVKNSLSGGQNLYLFQGTYSASRDNIIYNGNTSIVTFNGGGAALSSCGNALGTLQLNGLYLSNTSYIKWQNAAGSDVITLEVDASDDIVWRINATSVMRYDFSATKWIIPGSFSSVGFTDSCTATVLTLTDADGVFTVPVTGTSISASGPVNADRFKTTTGYTIAGLPSPVLGMITRITDGDSALAVGAIAVNSGSGATPYLVWYNGTNWKILGN